MKIIRILKSICILCIYSLDLDPNDFRLVAKVAVHLLRRVELVVRKLHLIRTNEAPNGHESP